VLFRVGNFPERFGAIKARIRLARAIERFLNFGLLVANDGTRRERAVMILLASQAFRRPSDDIAEQGLVRYNVVEFSQAVLQFHQE